MWMVPSALFYFLAEVEQLSIGLISSEMEEVCYSYLGCVYTLYIHKPFLWHIKTYGGKNPNYTTYLYTKYVNVTVLKLNFTFNLKDLFKFHSHS